jgi:hypothetical protein
VRTIWPTTSWWTSPPRSTSRRGCPRRCSFAIPLARRADPAPLPAGTGGEDAPNDELRGDGRPGQGPGESTTSSSAVRTPMPSVRSLSCSGASAGPPSASATSAASPPRAAPRCTSPCGSASGGRSEPATSTSPSCAPRRDEGSASTGPRLSARTHTFRTSQRLARGRRRACVVQRLPLCASGPCPGRRAA